MRGWLGHIVCASAAFIVLTSSAHAQCNDGYTFTASPAPSGGQYQQGQTVTFCYTVTNWTIVNVNWFHGLVPSFGPGWDISSLVPGPPPATCGPSTGTWDWYNICDGTATTAIGPVGPGFFFDLDNDGDPGDNFGDFCEGAVNWQFCFTITVAGGACVEGANLGVTVETYGDSETGAWGTAGCQGDVVAAAPATLHCCSADAGSNGAVAACNTDAAINLAAYLGGTPDLGGTWTAPGGAVTGSVINPATAASGNYTYTVSQIAPVCSSSATVAVTISAPPNAGTDGALTICSTTIGATALFPLLGGGAQAGGTWTNPSGGSSNGNFNPANHVPGIYTYTIPGTVPCPSDQATVLVTMNTPPNAGTDAAMTFCSTGAAAGLFASLGGGAEVGGTWTAPGGGAFIGTYDPAVDAPGIYTYTVTGTAPCPNDQATVTVTETAPPNAGTDGAITLCSTGAATGLFASLGGGAQAGGSWTGPGGGAFSGNFIPGTDAAGVYTYTVTGTAPCPNDQSTVTVTINTPPDPGTDGTI
ncbi:MAG TPA: hypothetical protein PLB89_13640, partial [Flavobacteriales bacterium]|nr:hypothetical protein [Flavobacteriales bacterium]